MPKQGLSAISKAAVVCAFVCLVSCSTTHYKESADREVYRLLAAKGAAVPGMEANFTIEAAEIQLEGLPVMAEEATVEFGDGTRDKFLGEAGQAEVGAHIISLAKSLEFAVKNGREYQSRKESVYLQALGFTETRQDYRPVFSGSASGALSAEATDVSKQTGMAQAAEGAPELIAAVGELVGTPADLLSSYANLVGATVAVTGIAEPYTAIHQERDISGRTTLGVNMLMRTGTEIAVGLTSNFLRFLTGDPNVSTSSALVASIQQPLLGSSRRTAAETLTQAERDLLYSLRSFARFRQSYAIDIASDYYRVLQWRDQVRNAYLGYHAFKKNLERSEAEAEAGRITKTALGRTKEEELRSRNTWVTAIQSYKDSLDEFKIRLGLSTDAQVVLDDKELEHLRELGLMSPPPFSLEDATQVAFAARLDYYTERDQLDDSARKLGLAADGLMPDIDLAFDAFVNSPDGDRFQELDFKRYAWDLGLDVNPKLNRKPYRNNYRKALIGYAATRRDFEEYEDNIKLELRQAWRALEQARVAFEIQQSSVAESERRVLQEELLFEAGRGDALDQIDAQNALNSARNGLSEELVNHTITNLRLWRDMGILYIKEDGQWEDVTDVEQYTKPEPSA